MRLISGVMLMLITAAAMAQPAPDTLWTKRYGGTHSDRIRDLQQTSDGGYILAGYSLSYSPETCYWVLRTDDRGDTLWTRVFGPMDDTYTPHIRQTADGGFIMAATTTTANHGYDILVLRLDDGGDTLWTRTFGGPSADYPSAIEPVTGGGFVVAGLTGSYGAGDMDIYLLRISDSGDSLWSQTYGGAWRDEAIAVHETADHGFALAGNTSPTGHDMGFYLGKTDSLGVMQWQRSYGPSSEESLGDMIVTRDGGYAFTGITSFGVPSNILVRTNSFGDTLWTNRWGTDASFEPRNVMEDVDGSFVVGGHTGALGGEHFCLTKVSAQGLMIWQHIYYTGSSHDLCFVMRPTSDGGFLLGGSSWFTDTPSQDARLVKLSSICGAPLAPQSVAIGRGDGTIHLFWSAVTESTEGCTGLVPEYRVFRSDQADGAFSLIGTTTTLSYEDSIATGEDARFYRVTAVSP